MRQARASGSSYLKQEAEEAEKKLQAKMAAQVKEEKERLKAKAERSQWTKEELAALTKATKKFPGGSRNRWASIANFLVSLGFERSQEECISATKKLQVKRSGAQDSYKKPEELEAKKPEEKKPEGGDKPKEWTSAQQAQLEKALKENDSKMDKNQRWRNIAEAVEGKTKKDCVQRFKYLRAKVKDQK